MTIVAIIIGIAFLINIWTIKNLRDERNFYKEIAIRTESKGRFGRRLEVERELWRQYSGIENIRK